MVVLLGLLVVVGLRLKDFSHPDLKTMALFGFGHDLVDFSRAERRLPLDWDEYARWYSSTRGTGGRTGKWASNRFRLLMPGAEIRSLRPGSIILGITDKDWLPYEVDFNSWLVGVLRGAVDDVTNCARRASSLQRAATEAGAEGQGIPSGQ